MPPGSGRTLCGDRARCGVEMNGDRAHPISGIPDSPSGATPCVFGSMADASQRNTLEGAALESESVALRRSAPHDARTTGGKWQMRNGPGLPRFPRRLPRLLTSLRTHTPR